jgi:hypothetical protein
MKYSILDPEVAGGLGANSKLDTSVHPPRVLKLHYEVAGWLGDDLVQSFPCYLVTRRLWQRLAALKPTGAATEAAEVTVSAEFKELDPNKAVPEVWGLKVTGAPGEDDLGLTEDARLVVSEPVLGAMRAMQLRHCGDSTFA